MTFSKRRNKKGFDGRFGAGLPVFYERVKPGPPAPDFTIIEDDDEEPPWLLVRGYKRQTREGFSAR
jgi:hypothetical protein